MTKTLTLLTFILLISSCSTFIPTYSTLVGNNPNERMNIKIYLNDENDLYMDIVLPNGKKFTKQYEEYWGNSNSTSLGVAMNTSGGMSPVLMMGSSPRTVISQVQIKNNNNIIVVKCYSPSNNGVGEIMFNGECEGFINGRKKYWGTLSRYQ
jgi:hypothetical protein